MKKSCF